MSTSEKVKVPCGSCKFMGWKGLEIYCCHPAHVEPLKPKRVIAIITDGGKCGNRVDDDVKILPGREQSWPVPVEVNQ